MGVGNKSAFLFTKMKNFAGPVARTTACISNPARGILFLDYFCAPVLETIIN